HPRKANKTPPEQLAAKQQTGPQKATCGLLTLKENPTLNRTDTLDLVHVLTRTHKTTIENDDGTRQYVEVHSYLDQLRDAFTGKGTGNGGNQTSAPISTNAFDLWQEITETTLKHWPGYGRPHLARTPLHRRIQQWASVAL